MKKLFNLFVLMLCSIFMFGEQHIGINDDLAFAKNGNLSEINSYSITGYTGNLYEDDRRGKKNYVHNSRFQRLSVKDQKRMKSLLLKLDKKERMAKKDGYLSNRERKQINAINQDINMIWAKYDNKRVSQRNKKCMG